MNQGRRVIVLKRRDKSWKLWLSMLCFLVALLSQVVETKQVGFSIQKKEDQRVEASKTTTVGPWDTQPANGRGLYISAVSFDAENNSPVIPQSGIYFVLLKIYLEKAEPKNRYGLRLQSSLSDRTLSAWKSNILSKGELSLSGNIKLSVGERILVKVDVEDESPIIKRTSWFSMQFLGQFGLLPSFLARPMIDERFRRNRNIAIVNWKTYHESMTSFSGAGGVFIPLVTGNYICSLNLVLEDIYGMILIAFKSEEEELLSLSKQFAYRQPVTSIHINKIFRLVRGRAFVPVFKALNASVVVSKTATFSCALSDYREKSMRLVINSTAVVDFSSSSKWWEVNLWKERQSSSEFQLLEIDGKVFSFAEQSLLLVSLSLTVETSTNDTIVAAVIPGGVSSEDGVFKSSLETQAKTQETLTLVGYIQIKEQESSHISVFLESASSTRLKLRHGDLKVIAIAPALSVITTPFQSSNKSIRFADYGWSGDWRALRIDLMVHEKPLRTSSKSWIVEEYFFSPKESGIYYVSVNLQAKLAGNASFNGSDNAIEARIVVIGNKGKAMTTLQHNIRGLNDTINSINLAGVYQLQSDEKIFVVYKCASCGVSKSSGFSAVWLFKLFKVEGFSTTITEPRNMLFRTKTVISKWSRHFSNFVKTSSFAFNRGIYEAPFDGVYLVTCSITLQRIPDSFSLKIRLGIANSTRSYSERFHVSSKPRRTGTVAISMPFWLKKGQSFSLLLESEGHEKGLVDVVLKKGSSLAIVALVDSKSRDVPGFTLSLRDNLVTSKAMLSSSLLGWTEDSMKGAFFRQSNSLYEFNQRQGEIIIRRSGTILLNIIVNLRINQGEHLTLFVKIEEKYIERVLTSRSSQDTRGEPLRMSVVLYVNSKDTIRVEVKRLSKDGIGNILKSTVMSAIFLSDVPSKPGLMLGVRGYKVKQEMENMAFRFKLKNSCTGCYQDNIIYREDEGIFKIPFAGRYLVSINFALQAITEPTSPSQCGIYSTDGEEFLAVIDIGKQSRFEIAEIIDFPSPVNLTFICESQDEIRFVDKNFISITLLQYEKPFTRSTLTKNESKEDTPNELSTYVAKSANYLVAVKGSNQTTSGVQMSVKSGEMNEVVIDKVDIKANSFNTFYTVVHLNETSHLSLIWNGTLSSEDRNKTVLYEVDQSSYSVTLHVSIDTAMQPCNKTSQRIRNWVKSHTFGNELNFDYGRSLFIAQQPGEYLVSANVRTVSELGRKRTLYMAIGDELEMDSFGVPLCATKNGQSCMTSFVTTIHLQKWQSVGLYIKLEDENDTLTILNGTRFSIILIEVNVLKQKDPGPRFVSQPWPVYTNFSSVFHWECDAVGAENIHYRWNWISRETKNLQIAGYGRRLRIEGNPEESGYYFCSAEMNGTLHNSRIATLDISDTDECNLNATEVGQLCHSDAYCINTIGSYLCRCNIGFQGNGFDLCEDIDECRSNVSCHVSADCNNTKGSYTCQCKPGFHGNGTHCEDINECAGATKCHPASDCINTIGDYHCVCKTGYSGNGETCININECNNEKYPCHIRASCADTNGAFTCTCNDGWTGNGTVCQDIDECSFIHCPGNASCHNEPGRYRCICNRGYKGDGFKYCEPLGCTPPAHCIGEYKAAWWPRSPYLANSSNQEPAGLFKDLLKQVLVDCCANCSVLSFDEPQNGSLGVEVEIEGNKTVDFGCPLYGSPDQTLFRGLPFMPVVESPGIAFFIKDQPKQKSALMGSLGSTWPILAITFLLACLSGVIIWFLDTVRNPTEFPNSFIEGSWEGFWWAFITMTTVGYGDKAPRSFPARLFGIVWILVGLVIISTFTATITTMLTASSLSDEAKLYGTKVGVLHNSEEYRLGVKRNAETKAYGSVAEIVQKIRQGEVQGILLDTYIAGEYQDQLKELRLQQVIDYTFSYGVVLSRDGLALRKCFSRFLESKQSQIYATISKVIKPLKTNGQQNFASQKSANIFDADSVYFKYIIIVGLGIFGLLFLIGLIWECYNARQQKRQYRLAKTSEPKEPEMMQWRVQWESGKVSHFNRNIFKSDLGDLKQQIKEFAETWITRLEDLEKKQEQEINDLKTQENKKNRRKESRSGLLFKYFRGAAKTDRNGTGRETAL